MSLEKIQVQVSYIIPAIPGPECRQLEHVVKQEVPYIEFTQFDSIKEIFPSLSDSKFKVDYIAVDVEYFYSMTNVEAYDIISTLKTLITCTVYRPTTGKPLKRNTKILAVVGPETDPNQLTLIVN